MHISIILTILVVILNCSYIPFANATDWSSCADELDRLRRAARDASDAAQQVESEKEELENCLDDPDTYDLMGDDCQSYRWDYNSARNNLESELNTVESRIRSVQWSCDYQFSLSLPSGTTTLPSKDPCSVYRTYKNKLPIATLIEICKKSMTEDECKKCLNIK